MPRARDTPGALIEESAKSLGGTYMYALLHNKSHGDWRYLLIRIMARYQNCHKPNLTVDKLNKQASEARRGATTERFRIYI